MEDPGNVGHRLNSSGAQGANQTWVKLADTDPLWLDMARIYQRWRCTGIKIEFTPLFGQASSVDGTANFATALCLDRPYVCADYGINSDVANSQLNTWTTLVSEAKNKLEGVPYLTRPNCRFHWKRFFKIKNKKGNFVGSATTTSGYLQGEAGRWHECDATLAAAEDSSYGMVYVMNPSINANQNDADSENKLFGKFIITRYYQFRTMRYTANT